MTQSTHREGGTNTIFQAMDPQQRLMLECSYEALENGMRTTREYCGHTR